MASGKKSKAKKEEENRDAEPQPEKPESIEAKAATLDSDGAGAEEEKVGEAATLEEDTQGELLKQLDEAVSKARDNHDRYLRAVAEQENFRKRTLREKEELRTYGAAGFMEDLLTVLDSFNIGLETARSQPESAPLVEGFDMVRTQLEAVMEQHGVTEINPEGEVFDPNSHEAVSQQPSDEVEDGNIIAVTRFGYRLHDRLLRAAAVVVSSGSPSESGEAHAEEKDVAGPA